MPQPMNAIMYRKMKSIIIPIPFFFVDKIFSVIIIVSFMSVYIFILLV